MHRIVVSIAVSPAGGAPQAIGHSQLEKGTGALRKGSFVRCLAPPFFTSCIPLCIIEGSPSPKMQEVCAT
jgi:hypothetical protein